MVRNSQNQKLIPKSKRMDLNTLRGFPEKPPDDGGNGKYPIPLWVKMIAYVLQPLNPLWGIRLAGPMGQSATTPKRLS